jgi:hypothetical protein
MNILGVIAIHADAAVPRWRLLDRLVCLRPMPPRTRCGQIFGPLSVANYAESAAIRSDADRTKAAANRLDRMVFIAVRY